VVSGLIAPLLRWYRRQGRSLPWRQTRDPYAIWVSEIMLQQTQVKTVLPYWNRWMRALPDLQSLARASEPQVLKLWEGLGYYSRGRNLRRAAGIIQARFHGQFPSHYPDLLSLPGVGPYTAGAICSIAFDQPMAALDGNVRRVLSRVFGRPAGNRPSAAAQQLWHLAQVLSVQVAARKGRRSGDSGDWNQALMDLGALVCTPRNPQCPRCPIHTFCRANPTRHASPSPGTQSGVRLVPRHFWAFAVEYDGKWLVRQRSNDGVNAGLWEFPNLEVKACSTDYDTGALSALGFTPAWLSPFLTLTHLITRNRCHLTVFHGTVLSPPPIPAANERWLTLAEADFYPFTAAHRRVVTALSMTSCISMTS
jgi:A/G-specific adenine glycosylase